jgi:hypothetical protein
LRFSKLVRIGFIQVPIAQKPAKQAKKLSRTNSRHTDLSELILGTSGQPQFFEIQGFKVEQFKKMCPKYCPK